MKVLLVGVGGVGEAIAVIAQKRPWIEKLVLADYNLRRAQEVQEKLQANEPAAASRFPAGRIDAGKQEQVLELAQTYQVDL